MTLSKYEIKELIKLYATEMAGAQARYAPSYSIAQPRPADYAPLAETIGEAIRDGLGSIATAIEYVGQLEDARERERNSR